MMEEGNKINIPIKGIQRAGEDSVAELGSMNEVIGLEYKDGSFVPYSESYLDVDRDVKGNTRKVIVHKTSEITNTLYLRNDGTLDLGDEIGTLVGVIDATCVGNMLCVTTDNGLDYYFFGSGKYSKYNSDLSELDGIAHLRVTAGLYNKKDYTEKPIFGINVIDDFPKTAVLKDTDISSHIIKCLGELRNLGGITGFHIATVAYRLKNGELIRAQSPVLLCPPWYNAYRDRDIQVIEHNKVKPEAINGTNVFLSSKTKTGSDLFLICNYFKYDTADVGSTKMLYNDELLVVDEYGIPIKNTTLIDKTGKVQYVNSEGEIVDAVTSQNILNLIPNIPIFTLTTAYIGEDTITERYFVSTTPSNIMELSIGDISNSEVQSVCVFLSKEISVFNTDDLKKLEHTINAEEGHEHYRKVYSTPAIRPFSSIKDEIEKVESLYKVAEYNVDELDSLKKEDGWISIDLAGKLGDSLVVRESLPVTAFNRTEYTGGHAMAYNYRFLHYGFKSNDFDGFRLDFFAHQGGVGQEETGSSQGRTFTYNVETKIKDNEEEYSVYSVSSGELPTAFNNIISYPSSNAYEMVVRIDEGQTRYEKTYQLVRNKNLGVSMYVSQHVIRALDGESKTATPISISKHEKDRKNVMRASDTAYPSYFDPKHTYTFGSGSIVGIATLSIALSQDMFGQYPVLIFCTDGVYALGVDTTGAGAFGTISPFSREVCVNSNSICQIDGAVLFATDKGLMVATQDGVQEFAHHLNGPVRHKPQTDKMAMGNGLELYNRLASDDKIAGLSTVTNEDFKDYLLDENTRISYVSKKHKVVVYNSTKPYCYWIDVATRNTTIIPSCIVNDNGDYPDVMFYRHDGSVNYSKVSFEYNPEVVSQKCLFQSRPIRITESLKKGFRVVARGKFEGEESEDWAVLLVLGSIDGEHWHCIGLRQRKLLESKTAGGDAAGFHDIGCTVEHCTWNYAMIIFGGRLNSSSHIDLIEMTAIEKYNNKLK